VVGTEWRIRNEKPSVPARAGSIKLPARRVLSRPNDRTRSGTSAKPAMKPLAERTRSALCDRRAIDHSDPTLNSSHHRVTDVLTANAARGRKEVYGLAIAAFESRSHCRKRSRSRRAPAPNPQHLTVMAPFDTSGMAIDGPSSSDRSVCDCAACARRPTLWRLRRAWIRLVARRSAVRR
jgi:hypothetical protein